MITSVARAARLGCCPIERKIRRYSGANTMARTVAHSTALKKGQRIHAKASDTAMSRSIKARSSRVRTRSLHFGAEPSAGLNKVTHERL
jgi:hypothetical protein